jgi:uncharacterized protein
MSAKTIPSGDTQPVGVAIGVSSRALCHALVHTGFRVISVDAFGDSDCAELAEHSLKLSKWGAEEALIPLQHELHEYYCSVHRGESNQQRLPVFLAGGCENWPELLDVLKRSPHLTIWGPDTDQMRRLRSLDLWSRAAAVSGLKFPETIGAQGLPQPGPSHARESDQWLLKSLHGAGGTKVTSIPWDPTFPDSIMPGRYVQKRIVGRVLGATCIIQQESAPVSQDHLGTRLDHPDPTGQEDAAGLVTRLIGITESWQAGDFWGPKEFIYRGSWGPIRLNPKQVRQIKSAAEFLGKETGTRGWIQLDLVEDDRQRLWLLEVNPRWTAGMEILLRSGGPNPVAEHAAAWGWTGSAANWNLAGANEKQVGKSICYSPKHSYYSRELLSALQSLPNQQFADIAATDSLDRNIEIGEPLLTAIAETPDSLPAAVCRNRLLERLRDQLQVVLDLLPERG